ncbi:MAG: glycosyltransferase family 2 protein [Candidatus Omnitrophica bacterium]|nr:glycosyltransferase family 2 protein [Candidatus Omnitrophota bacterium]
MKTLKETVSVIMPAYNEGRQIFNNIEETVKIFKEFECDYEIVVVDDGSPDNTYEEIQRAANTFRNIIAVQNKKNYGKGRALKKGFRYTKGEYIVFLDSDMDLHPIQLQTFIDIMRLDDADVVIGSKRHPNSKLDYPWHRKFVSAVYFFLIKLMFGLPINDTQTGLKLFKREVLEKVFSKLLVKKFAYDLEILVLAHHIGFKIAEAPIVMKSQAGIWPMVRPRHIVETLWDTMAIWYRMYVLKYYD